MIKFVLVACLVATALALPSEWDQEMRDYILDMHNEHRKNEGGCQMNKLEYDMDLESQAKGWAEGCVFKHENLEGRGENLAWDTNHLPEKDMIKGSYGRWFDEKNMYSYGQSSCSQSCHYTQLVWDKTQKVGCWTTRCPNLQYAYTDAWYLVCFYTPMGNWVGEKPYQKQCDAPCREGQTEEDGLCVGEAVDHEKEAEEACDDKKPECPAWAEDGQCEDNPSYMMKHCKLSCTECGPKPTTACVDDNEECSKWAGRGECGKNPNYMKKHCKLSCDAC